MTLGIDLGEKTTGLAISYGQISTPYKTITHESKKEAVEKVSEVIGIEKINKVVLGFVEGKIKKLFDEFAKDLKEKNPDVEIVFWDETLSTRQAQDLAITLGKSKVKRKAREHELAAAMILQSYLDETA